MTKAKVRKERKTCMVCTKRYLTGAALIYKGKPPEQETMWGLCPDHGKLRDQNLIALVVIDPTKSNVPEPGETVLPDVVHRTGVVVYVPRPTYRTLFGDDPPDTGVAFVPPDVQAILERIKAAKDGTQPH